MRSLPKGAAASGLLGKSVYASFDLGVGYGGTGTVSVGLTDGLSNSNVTWVTYGVAGGFSVGGGFAGGVCETYPLNF